MSSSESLNKPTVKRIEAEQLFFTVQNGSTLTATKLSNFMYQEAFVNGLYSDVKIQVFEKEFSLHRIILNRSSYFASLFSGPWKESGSDVIKISFKGDANVTLQAFELAIQFLYGKFDLAVARLYAQSLLATASFLDVPDLVELSTELVIISISMANVASVLLYAMDNDYGLASDRIIKSCKNVLGCAGCEAGVSAWNLVPTQIAAEVISSDIFFVPNEWERCMFTIMLIEQNLKYHSIKNEKSNFEFSFNSKTPSTPTTNNGDSKNLDPKLSQPATPFIFKSYSSSRAEKKYSVEPLRRTM
ncbi:hypothetical protein V1514DRAFT_345121 [Lipomyces japonicus]|uniref:uncharacterized protein n=1 Tax=Lipomyces japonicus TaxID=56871 RepID=UPI0034CE8CAF